nr:PREDICTED: uncharacterized protein LOC103314921 [Tribolium castaneum]|eukprot:XP_008200442.1 PREDICTED: uncharacterized protein LOC103314921 [Tribolium castaneum]
MWKRVVGVQRCVLTIVYHCLIFDDAMAGLWRCQNCCKILTRTRMCSKGHTICWNCSKCPCSRTLLTEARNFNIEELVSELGFEGEVEEAEPVSVVKCPVRHCRARSTFDCLAGHLQNCHQKSITVLSERQKYVRMSVRNVVCGIQKLVFFQNCFFCIFINTDRDLSDYCTVEVTMASSSSRKFSFSVNNSEDRHLIPLHGVDTGNNLFKFKSNSLALYFFE